MNETLTRPRAAGSETLTRLTSLRWLLVLPWVTALTVALLALWVGDPAAFIASGADTLPLLRGFAGLKAAIILAALLAVSWRLTWPASQRLIAGYLVAIAAMAAAAGLVWQLTWLGPVSMLFHGGLLLFLLTAWRDSARG